MSPKWWNVLGPRNTIIQFEPFQIHLYKPKESKISVRAAHDGGCVCGRIMSGAKIGERPRMQICILWISSSKSPFTTYVSSSMLRLCMYFVNGHIMDIWMPHEISNFLRKFWTNILQYCEKFLWNYLIVLYSMHSVLYHFVCLNHETFLFGISSINFYIRKQWFQNMKSLEIE